MDFTKSKRLRILSASAFAFILATLTSLFLLTSDNDANAKSKKTQTTLMAKQKAPEAPQPAKNQTSKKKDARVQQEVASGPTPAPTKPKSLEERLKDDLQKARDACKQNQDVAAFRTACAVANTIARNKLNQSGANAETFKKYYQEAVEIAETSGERLQKKNNIYDKPLVFVF